MKLTIKKASISSQVVAFGILILAPNISAVASPKALSDEDILSPSKLIFDQTLEFVDSFDGSPRGKVFVTKRSIVGSPLPEYGVIGEKGSSRYTQICQWFCPPKTTDIDATYLYVFEIKGECEIGVRAIGWTEQKKSYDGLLGPEVVTGTVRYTAQPVNIDKLLINDVLIGPPSNNSKLASPHGTNYKYFPRNKGVFSQTTADSTDLSAGFITDIHYFSAAQLVSAANSGQALTIKFPSWKPSVMNISGKSLEELKMLTSKCT